MDIYYKAGYSNRKIIFDNKNYWIDISGLLEYKWTYTTFNNRIAEFSKGISERKFSVIVNGTEDMSLAKANNEMIDIFNTDVISHTPGRIYINEYYLEGYVIKSSKLKYENSLKNSYTDGFSENSFYFITEQEFWRKETIFTYGREFLNKGLTYPKGYPYGYVNSGKKIINKNTIPCDFEMTIYGACDNPAVSVGLNTYEFNDLSLDTGEYIKIISDRKTAVRVDIKGNKESVFSNRNRNFDVFEKIPAGNTMLAWSDGLVFDIMLISERGEPEWTKN